MAAPTMLEHRQGLELKTNHAERAGLKCASQTYQPNLRENSRAARDRQNLLV